MYLSDKKKIKNLSYFSISILNWKKIYEVTNRLDKLLYRFKWECSGLQILPSSSWSPLNHSTLGTGLPSPLSQYRDIIEPSFIGPKIAPVLRVFFEFSSMTRTNDGWTETYSIDTLY